MEEPNWTDDEKANAMQKIISEIRNRPSLPWPDYMLIDVDSAKALGIESIGQEVRNENIPGVAFEIDLRKK